MSNIDNSVKGNSNLSPSGEAKGGLITGAEALMRSLEHEGVETLFGYPGGAIMPTFDALYDHKETLNHILVRHEQAAVHAAQAQCPAGRHGAVHRSDPGSAAGTDRIRAAPRAAQKVPEDNYLPHQRCGIDNVHRPFGIFVEKRCFH